jgi:hypothetical protein
VRACGHKARSHAFNASGRTKGDSTRRTEWIGAHSASRSALALREEGVRADGRGGDVRDRRARISSSSAVYPTDETSTPPPCHGPHRSLYSTQTTGGASVTLPHTWCSRTPRYRAHVSVQNCGSARGPYGTSARARARARLRSSASVGAMRSALSARRCRRRRPTASPCALSCAAASACASAWARAVARTGGSAWKIRPRPSPGRDGAGLSGDETWNILSRPPQSARGVTPCYVRHLPGMACEAALIPIKVHAETGSCMLTCRCKHACKCALWDDSPMTDRAQGRPHRAASLARRPKLHLRARMHALRPTADCTPIYWRRAALRFSALNPPIISP